MKFKILISCMLVMAVIIYSFTRTDINSAEKLTSTDPNQNKFILGAMHDARDSVYTYLYDTLNFNMWHKYTVPNGWGWPIIGSNNTLPTDQLDTPVYRYASDIRERINLNNTENLMTLLDRPKFEYLAFGQRSDYQCEQASKVDPDYWFYTYYNSTDNGTSIKDTLDNSNGSGGYVKRCLYARSDPGANAQMLFDSLKGNMEQINTHWPVTWLGDQHYDWHIMPRIRIDSVFANNPANKNIDVCKIIIKNRDGDSITQNIKVMNFKLSDTSIYSGNYLEEFYNYDIAPIENLIIPAGDWFNDNPGISFGDTLCRIDFKVFWYDKCDMWIDRIRVEDEPAHKLLTLHEQELEDWIQHEVQDIAMAEINIGNQSPYKFYIEEFEMNHLQSIGYLNKKIIDYSGGRLSLMVNYNHDLVKAFIPNSWSKLLSAVQVKKYLIDSAKLREIFTLCYNLEGWRNGEHEVARESYVPNTLYNGLDYQIQNGLLAYKKSPADYDYWIQEHFDNYSVIGLNLKHIFEFSDSISKIGHVPFQYLSQAHLWIGNGHMLKEPTNEEITLSNNLAISYGAKGIMYFAWGSTNSSFDTSGVIKECARGLTNYDNSPRRVNVYGQNKWEMVKSNSKKYMNWEPYIMSFDNLNRRSFIYRNPTERELMSANTFIKKLEAFPAREFAPDPIPDFTNSFAETNNSAYLQVAFFQKENETEQSKYFMIVNRRCSPFIDYTSPDKIGGRRLVTIKVNPSNLPGFTNWKIYNLETGDTSITFSKYDTAHFVFVGDFLPGEGKLYKIAPVMQEGGTLVADESVSGVQIICKGMVLNNIKNITLGTGTKIQFKTGAGINMSGGNFICTDSSSSSMSGGNHVLLQGYNDEQWSGISLTNSGSTTRIERTTFENTKSPLVIYNSNFSAQYAQKIIRRNIFKVTQDSGTALRINNQFALSIDSNTFDVSNYNSTSGIYFSNYTDPGAAGAVPEDHYNVNITNNTFSGAYFPVMINNLGTAYSSFYMYNNQFVNTGLFGISGMKITGTIKNNRFVNPAGNYSIYLSLSNPDIYGNFFSSDKRNMILSASYPNIAPIRNSNNELIWKGGRNGFYINNNSSDTSGKENIFFRSSLPLTDYGENDFSIPSSSSYHIFGSNSEQTSRIYLTRRNCWTGNNDIPKIFIFNPNDTPVTPIGFVFPPTNCIPSDNISNNVTNIGFDINDTTFISANSSIDTISQDEALYSEAVEMLSNNNYTEAGMNFKSLIDQFPSGDFIYSSEYYLYDCYCGLDTSSDQSITDVLFGDLKQYLQAKISSGNYDDDFEDNAYYLILMCDNKMENYNSALTGYEFISLYHPDADRRIQASWEYDNIENLMSGSGGGEKELTLEDFIDRRFKTIEEFADNDPATKKIKQNYMKANDEKKIIKEQSENKTKNFQNIYNRSRSFENDEKLFERAKQNLYLSKRSSKEEKERRRFDDIKIMLNPDNVQVSSKELISLIPTQYSLSQNYPNPFNPITKINFELPVDSKVDLIVYDLLGREVIKLVNNEFRTAGSYNVSFNGSNLSSGVYFYKLKTADNVVLTKRMVLIK